MKVLAKIQRNLNSQPLLVGVLKMVQVLWRTFGQFLKKYKEKHHDSTIRKEPKTGVLTMYK